jgi:hypothetical protein
MTLHCGRKSNTRPRGVSLEIVGIQIVPRGVV